MKDFITELGVVPSALGPMEIYCDNNGAQNRNVHYIRYIFVDDYHRIYVPQFDFCTWRSKMNVHVSMLRLVLVCILFPVENILK